jgi:hypothetical protein
MVAGNWERRVELANKAKALKKENKELKAKGLLVSADELLSRLFSVDPDADVYLLAGTGPVAAPPNTSGRKGHMFSKTGSAVPDQKQQQLCHAHFRFEACTNRRCKWSHRMSIGSLRNPCDQDEASPPPVSIPDVECNRGVTRLLWPNEPAWNASPITRASVSQPDLDCIPDLALPGGALAAVSVTPGRTRQGTRTETTLLSLSLVPGLLELLFGHLVDGSICALARVSKLSRGLALSSAAVNCRKVQLLPRLRARRNRELLKASNASRLRYAASYHGGAVDDPAAAAAAGAAAGWAAAEAVVACARAAGGRRGTLVHDWENIEVFRHWDQQAQVSAAPSKGGRKGKGRGASFDDSGSSGGGGGGASAGGGGGGGGGSRKGKSRSGSGDAGPGQGEPAASGGVSLASLEPAQPAQPAVPELAALPDEAAVAAAGSCEGAGAAAPAATTAAAAAAAAAAPSPRAAAVLGVHTDWTALPEAALSAVLALSDGPGLGAVSSLCRAFRTAAKLDGAARARRREGMREMQERAKKVAKKAKSKGKKMAKARPGKKDGMR